MGKRKSQKKRMFSVEVSTTVYVEARSKPKAMEMAESIVYEGIQYAVGPGEICMAQAINIEEIKDPASLA